MSRHCTSARTAQHNFCHFHKLHKFTRSVHSTSVLGDNQSCTIAKFNSGSKKARVTTTLKRFNGEASNVLLNIPIGDEIWIYSYGPEMQDPSSGSVFHDEPVPRKVVGARKTDDRFLYFVLVKRNMIFCRFRELTKWCWLVGFSKICSKK